ncbi:MAG: 3-phosphoshikimate 1-carboxyvinyltransferase [Finegoldia magna]|uniref:3-phosphoshikimate 1-carboxyvinyltransferase n=1 Tax=Finegoldia magna TaxID=1260 RepID=UPI0029130A21|nr:3-phosphoshikimate 1-carboxyvinyltransferase [Finegoldia magna]MDU5368622.1 3-phosphoshikimate 1-carboxyvinyltransferase [Finegoldia magna]MDU5444371.1 3-phosphoshikimate 1-carboxyvinyltransferase [Finegoldia magna]MDU7384591.1 3-phosphoshikimate 1-carboxyvinyltransferase [Finegoldia magna]
MKIKTDNLQGTVDAISSKSFAHRFFILASVADSDTTIIINEFSNDIMTTIDCLRNLGVEIDINENEVTVHPSFFQKDVSDINVNDSGSTLRFLLPLVSFLSQKTNVKCTGRLQDRPIKELMDQLKLSGLTFSEDKLPFTVDGTFHKIDFEFPGDVSSQYISAIMMIAPLIGGCEIKLTSQLESTGYIKITQECLRLFGVDSEILFDKVIVKPGALKSPGEIIVEGDWSNAAFFLCANELGADINVQNLNMDSIQADRKIVELLEKTNKNRDYCEIDISQTPDLFVILAVVLSQKCDKSVLKNGKRLRLKESDRIQSTYDMLKTFGVNCEIEGDNLVIYKSEMKPAVVNSFDDHRIVMAAAIASIITKEVEIKDWQAVKKSYPSFYDEIERLGSDVIDR